MAIGQKTPFTMQYQRIFGICASGDCRERERTSDGVRLTLNPTKAQSATTRAATIYPRQSHLIIQIVIVEPSASTKRLAQRIVTIGPRLLDDAGGRNCGLMGAKSVDPGISEPPERIYNEFCEYCNYGINIKRGLSGRSGHRTRLTVLSRKGISQQGK
jgi:hypothetical protein